MLGNRIQVVVATAWMVLGCLPGTAQTIDQAAKERAARLVSQMTLEEKLAYIGGDASDFGLRPVERLGIPAIRMSDGPQGVHDKDAPAVLYPCGIALAATWNRDLARRCGAAIGADARARGIHIMLGPGVNIYRSPLCGRNFEYYGEDPYLVSETASGYIKGMQGQGVMAVVKHFCGNNSEWSRHNSSSDIDERTLHEIYFPAFRKAVQEAQVGAVMSSYNLVNSVHTTESPYLARTILRDTWGFDGIFVSDWAATYSGVAAANAGLDLEMPNALYMNADCLKDALANGLVTEQVIDEKCIHILQTLAAFGFLDREQGVEGAWDPSSSREVALDMAREAVVLLKNEGETLPFSRRVRKVAVLGPGADAVVSGGGSGFVTPEHEVTVSDGLRAVAGRRFHVTADPAGADVIVYCAGFNQSIEKEGSDRPFRLPSGQEEEIRTLSALPGRLVVVVNAGGGVDFSRFASCADAILLAWYPGQEGGRAVAEILTGLVNPSGKLPISIERTPEDNPTWGSYYANELKQLGSPYDRIRYKEGVFVGYRGYDRSGTDPLYPFGYGLSYTAFSYGGLSCVAVDGEVDLSFEIKNTGRRSGAEIVQVYVGECDPCVPRPVKELKEYRKVELEAGASATVRITLAEDAFSFYDVGTHAFRVNHGRFRIGIGSSSRDIRLDTEVEY